MPAPSAPRAPEASSGSPRRRRGGLTPVLLVRAAHPRQAVAHRRRDGRRPPPSSGRPPREVALVAGHRAGRPGRSSAGTTTWSTRPPTGRPSAATSRSPPARSTAAPSASPWRCAVLLLVIPLALSRTASPPGSAYLASLAVGLRRNRWLHALGRSRGCPGRSRSALLPGVPLLRRLGRRRRRVGTAHAAMTVRVRGARRRRARPDLAAAAWSTTTRPRRYGTSRCGSPCSVGAPRSCSSSRRSATRAWSLGGLVVAGRQHGRDCLAVAAPPAPASLSPVNLRRDVSRPASARSWRSGRRPRRVRIQLPDRPGQPAHRRHQLPLRHGRRAERGRSSPGPTTRHLRRHVRQQRARRQPISRHRHAPATARRSARSTAGQPVPIAPSGLVNLADQAAASPCTGTFTAGPVRPARPDLRQRRDRHDERARGRRRRPVGRPRPGQPSPTRSRRLAGRTPAPRPAPPRADMTSHPGPAPPRRERVERQEPLHRLGRRDALSDKGRGRGAPRRRAAARRADLLPDVVHTSLLRRAITHRRDLSPRRRRPALDPGAPQSGGSTSATTARCRARTRSRRSRSTARSSSCSGAARFDVPPPPIDDDDEFSQAARRALRRPRRRAAPHASASRTSSPGCCPTGTAAIVPTTCSAGQTVLVAAHGNSLRAHRQAPRRHQRRRHRRAQHPDRDAAGLRARRRPAAHRRRAAATSTPTPPPRPPQRSPTRVASRSARGTSALRREARSSEPATEPARSRRACRDPVTGAREERAHSVAKRGRASPRPSRRSRRACRDPVTDAGR